MAGNASNPLMDLIRGQHQQPNRDPRLPGNIPAGGPNPMTMHMDPAGIQAAAMRRIGGGGMGTGLGTPMNSPTRNIQPINPPPLYQPPAPGLTAPVGGDLGRASGNPQLPVSPIGVPPLQSMQQQQNPMDQAIAVNASLRRLGLI